MSFDQSASILALSDTTRPILLIGFIVGLFALAGLGVFFGRKHMAAQNARALSDDTGLAKGATKGGDGTFSSDWLAEAREDIDDTPRQSWADVLTFQGVGEVTDNAPSPFGATTAAAEDPALGFAATPGTYQPPTYPVESPSPVQGQPMDSQPVYDASSAPEAPAHEAPVYATAQAYDVEPTPAYEAPVYATEQAYDAPVAPTHAPPVVEAPTYEAPTFETPTGQYAAIATENGAETIISTETVVAPPAQPVVEYPAPVEQPVYETPTPAQQPLSPAAPGEEYATFFGATPPPPPPPPVEPFNIWAPDPDER